MLIRSLLSLIVRSSVVFMMLQMSFVFAENNKADEDLIYEKINQIIVDSDLDSLKNFKATNSDENNEMLLLTILDTSEDLIFVENAIGLFKDKEVIIQKSLLSFEVGQKIANELHPNDGFNVPLFLEKESLLGKMGYQLSEDNAKTLMMMQVYKTHNYKKLVEYKDKYSHEDNEGLLLTILLSSDNLDFVKDALNLYHCDSILINNVALRFEMSYQLPNDTSDGSKKDRVFPMLSEKRNLLINKGYLGFYIKSRVFFTYHYLLWEIVKIVISLMLMIIAYNVIRMLKKKIKLSVNK